MSILYKKNKKFQKKNYPNRKYWNRSRNLEAKKILHDVYAAITGQPEKIRYFRHVGGSPKNA